MTRDPSLCEQQVNRPPQPMNSLVGTQLRLRHTVRSAWADACRGGPCHVRSGVGRGARLAQRPELALSPTTTIAKITYATKASRSSVPRIDSTRPAIARPRPLLGEAASGEVSACP